MKQVDINISIGDSDLFDQIISENDWGWYYESGFVQPDFRRFRTVPLTAEELTDLYDALDWELDTFEFHPF